MKLLVIVPYYPHESHPYSGAFNERTVQILKSFCECVEVVVPRPYTPKLFSKFSHRWRTYANIPPFELRNGVPIFRPVYFTFPKIGGALTREMSCYLGTRKTIRKRHEKVGFDAILSFDLYGAGSLAWRIGRDLGIPACGWGTGADLAQPPGTMRERIIQKALRNLDLVFYQSQELLCAAATILGEKPEALDPKKHFQLARGIGDPPLLDRPRMREQLRTSWGFGDEDIVVMNISRAARAKGIFELLHIAETTGSLKTPLHFVWIGGQEGFDDGQEVRNHLKQNGALREKFHFLPGCHPDEVWQYLCAADIFAFPSHHTEGMPNSLLEAMMMEVPAVAFGISSVREIDAGSNSVACVEPFNTKMFTDTLIRLAGNKSERQKIGILGREQVTKKYLAKNNMNRALYHLSQLTPHRDKDREEPLFVPLFSSNG